LRRRRGRSALAAQALKKMASERDVTGGGSKVEEAGKAWYLVLVIVFGERLARLIFCHAFLGEASHLEIF